MGSVRDRSEHRLVLVVEDEPAIAEVISMYLTKGGYRIRLNVYSYRNGV